MQLLLQHSHGFVPLAPQIRGGSRVLGFQRGAPCTQLGRVRLIAILEGDDFIVVARKREEAGVDLVPLRGGGLASLAGCLSLCYLLLEGCFQGIDLLLALLVVLRSRIEKRG